MRKNVLKTRTAETKNKTQHGLARKSCGLTQVFAFGRLHRPCGVARSLAKYTPAIVLRFTETRSKTPFLEQRRRVPLSHTTRKNNARHTNVCRLRYENCVR